MTLVRKNFPAANAAEFSNTGRVWCNAVYNATGLIYEPTLQTCLFDDSWPAGSGDRRRLGASDDECDTDISEDLDKLKTQLENSHAEELDKLKTELKAELKITHAEELTKLKSELNAAHAQELKRLDDKLSEQQEQTRQHQEQTNALLEKLLNRTCSD